MAQKELAAARKSAADDAETLAAIEVIEEHLASAAETHKTLHAACNKDDVDGCFCTHCCTEIAKKLDEALAEHAALMKKLDTRDLKPAPQKFGRRATGRRSDPPIRLFFTSASRDQ